MNEHFRIYLIVCSIALYGVQGEWSGHQKPHAKGPLANQLASAISTGKSIPKGVSDPWKRLGLAHFFTPSGLHLRAIRKSMGSFNTPVFAVLVAIFALGLTQLWALQRMAVANVVRFFTKSWVPVAMTLCLWHLWYSPIGFIYSTLFLMALVQSDGKLQRSFQLLLAQIATTSILGSSLSVWLPAATLLITPLLCTLIPLIMYAYFTDNVELIAWPLETIHHCIVWLDHHSCQFEMNIWPAVAFAIALKKPKFAWVGLVIC